MDVFSNDLPEVFVLGDTEFVWPGQGDRSNTTGAGEVMRIVQGGFIAVDRRTLQGQRNLVLFVQGVEVSDYFTNLTGITQETANARGVSYQDFLERLRCWCNGAPIFCYGYDMRLMAEYAQFLGVPFPFPRDDTAWEASNIRNLFQRYGIDVSKYSSGTLPRAFGEEPPPDQHDALNDSRSILQALQALAREISH